MSGPAELRDLLKRDLPRAGTRAEALFGTLVSREGTYVSTLPEEGFMLLVSGEAGPGPGTGLLLALGEADDGEEAWRPLEVGLSALETLAELRRQLRGKIKAIVQPRRDPALSATMIAAGCLILPKVSELVVVETARQASAQTLRLQPSDSLRPRLEVCRAAIGATVEIPTPDGMPTGSAAPWLAAYRAEVPTSTAWLDPAPTSPGANLGRLLAALHSDPATHP